MKFNPKTHIIGKVYDLTQKNMCAMLDEIDRLRSGYFDAQAARKAANAESEVARLKEEIYRLSTLIVDLGGEP